MAQLSGRRIVQMVKDDLKPSDILTKEAFENAIRTNAAIGGSTNAVIHLLAIAGRVGVDLTLDDWDRCGRDVPTIVNLMPSGEYLMEEFFYAGGLPVVIKRLGEMGLLHKDALTVSGETGLGAGQGRRELQRGRDPARRAGADPVGRDRRSLKGNLAPNGAVLKPSAATPALMVHRGRAVVFEDIDDYKAKIDDEALDIDETCVMVLKNCGPKGYPGMAEVGQHGPAAQGPAQGHHRHGPHLGRADVGDGLRDGGAAHLARGGGRRPARHRAGRRHDRARRAEPPPAPRRARRGDRAARLADWAPPGAGRTAGYAQLHHRHVTGADTGADLDFLKGCRGAAGGQGLALMPIPVVCIVGVGKIAHDQHVPAIAASPDWELAADRRRARGRVEGVPIFRDFDVLLAERPDIEVVSLCLPPQPRFQYARKALQAGRARHAGEAARADAGRGRRTRGRRAEAGVTLFATWHSRMGKGAVGGAKAALAGQEVDGRRSPGRRTSASGTRARSGSSSPAAWASSTPASTRSRS